MNDEKVDEEILFIKRDSGSIQIALIGAEEWNELGETAHNLECSPHKKALGVNSKVWKEYYSLLSFV